VIRDVDGGRHRSVERRGGARGVPRVPRINCSPAWTRSWRKPTRWTRSWQPQSIWPTVTFPSRRISTTCSSRGLGWTPRRRARTPRRVNGNWIDRMATTVRPSLQGRTPRGSRRPYPKRSRPARPRACSPRIRPGKVTPLTDLTCSRVTRSGLPVVNSPASPRWSREQTASGIRLVG
jgi:hypothetical protein